MKKRTISWLLAMTMAATTMAGCMTVNAEEASFDGTIRWLNYKPEIADQMNDVAAAYTEETGIDVVVETAASGQYEATLTARMDSSEAPSIFIIDGGNMLTTWKDYMADLSGTDLYSYVSSDTYAKKDGDKVDCICYVVEHWGIIVNKAIMEKYFTSENKSTEYTSLDDLYTFDALKAVVEDMTSMKDELGIDGVFGSTALKAGDDWRYQTHLMNLPTYWEWGADVDTFGVIPEFTFEYADNYKNILDLYLNNSVTEPKLVGTKTVDDSMAEFALGKCAMIQNGDWAWSTIANTDGKAVADEDVCFIPITMGVEGEENMGLSAATTLWLCINNQVPEEEQAAAADFLAWLFSSETGKKLVSEELQLVTPFTTMEGAVYTNALFASASEIEASGKTSYSPACNLLPSQTWKNDFGANLLLYAQGQMEWDDVVSAAVDEWAVEMQYTNAAK